MRIGYLLLFPVFPLCLATGMAHAQCATPAFTQRRGYDRIQ